MPLTTLTPSAAEKLRLRNAVDELKLALGPWAAGLKIIQERGAENVDLSKAPVLAQFVEICRRYA